MSDEELRKWAVDVVRSMMSPSSQFYSHDLTKEAEQLVDYVKRTGDYEKRDNFKAAQLIERMKAEEQWFFIVCRLPNAADSVKDQISELLKETPALVWDSSTKTWNF